MIYVKTTDPKLVNVDIRILNYLMNTYYGEFVPKRKSASYQGVVKNMKNYGFFKFKTKGETPQGKEILLKPLCKRLERY